MKTHILLPVSFLVLLSSCQPRDIKYLPDSALQGRKNSSFAEGKSGSLNLSDFATATHIAERELEALAVLELSLNGNPAPETGFRADRDHEGVRFVRSHHEEKYNDSTLTSLESWSKSEQGYEGNAVRTFEKEIPATSAARAALTQTQPKATLNISEFNKLISISMLAEGRYTISYSMNGLFSQKRDVTDEASQVYQMTGTMEVERKAPHQFLVHKSNFTFMNKRPAPADADWYRTMTVSTTEGQPLEMTLGDCPSIKGSLNATHNRGAMQLSFADGKVTQTGGRGDAELPLVACEDNQKRPLLDFSRLLNK